MHRPIPGFTMQDIKADLGIEEIDPHGKSIPQWAELLDRSIWTTRKLIQAKVEAGTWIKCKVRTAHNHLADGYRPRLKEETRPEGG